MPLSPGTSLGPYQVTAKIGEGGMGEVWQARDTKLDRDVALKVLPEAFTSDPDRLARFEREAKVLASLNHPNIGSIYGLEEADGVKALVLELIEGPTLADRIAQGPIPIDEALLIAKQIAEALEAAHEQGVIHRDLKPANIKVKDDGTVKVLDFGLAKAFQPDAGDPNLSASPTISLTAAATQMGMVIGTAAYMAPEQAKGLPVDKRADIWAYGAVLFEMLTGNKLFDAGDVSEMLASVLVKDPDISSIGNDVPAHIRSVVRQCLVKEPKQRMRDIGDVRLAMQGASDSPAATGVLDPQRRHGRLVLLGLGGVAVGAFIWSVALPMLWTDTRPMVTRFVVTAAPSDAVAVSAEAVDLAISPDGATIVYRSGENPQLYVRAVDELEGRRLGGTEGALMPFFSPDGEWIGFQMGSALMRVSVDGGAAFTLCALASPLTGASWGEDGRIIFAGSTIPGGLFEVDADGGEPQVLTVRDANTDRWPRHLPGGRQLLFTRGTGSGAGDKEIAVLDLDTDAQTLLGVVGSGAHYVSTGHLVYGTNGTLWAVPFDSARVEVLGAPVPMVEGVMTRRDALAAINFSVAQNGSLVYIAGEGGEGRQDTLAWVDRRGVAEPLPAEPKEYFYPRISPDGTRVALDVRGQENDIWIWSVRNETLTNLTRNQTVDNYPVWTPDSQRVIFDSGRGEDRGVFMQAASGTGGVQRLAAPGSGVPLSISPDESHLLLNPAREPGGFDIDVLSLSDQTVAPLLGASYNERNAVISNDGRWVAYEASESGQNEIYVRPFPEVENDKWQISTAGGRQPAWHPRGDELFYWTAGGFTAVSLAVNGDGLSRGTPEVLFPSETYSVGDQGRTYDVAPDGERFLMIKRTPADAPTEDPQIIIVENWTQELLERVPLP